MAHEKGVKHVTPTGKRMLNYIINYPCNNNCVMCIIDRPDTRENSSLEDIKKRFDDLDGYDGIFISGGEPTIRPDFFKIMNNLKKKFNGDIYLLTNARMFSIKAFFVRFVNLKMKKIKICIPLYNCNHDAFEKVSKSTGSFEQTIDGIKNLINEGYNIELRIIIHKLNYMDLENISRFIVKELNGVGSVFFGNLEYVGNGLGNIDDIFVSYDEIRHHLEKAVKILKENDVDFSLNQVPLCKIDEKYRDYASNSTIVPDEHIFLQRCNDCTFKKRCSGIWKSYFIKGKEEEFIPIR